jgi:hypothetical protein
MHLSLLYEDSLLSYSLGFVSFHCVLDIYWLFIMAVGRTEEDESWIEMYKEEIKGNREKIKVNEKLPYLVGNIVISFAYVLRDNLSVFCVFWGNL